MLNSMVSTMTFSVGEATMADSVELRARAARYTCPWRSARRN